MLREGLGRWFVYFLDRVRYLLFTKCLSDFNHDFHNLSSSGASLVGLLVTTILMCGLFSTGLLLIFTTLPFLVSLIPLIISVPLAVGQAREIIRDEKKKRK